VKRLLVLALAVVWTLYTRPAAAAETPPPALDRGIVSTASVVTPDGGTVQVEGGCWLDARVCVATGRELVQLRSENAALRVAVVGLALVAAGAAGFALHAHLAAQH
jgi:hypothetical protein